MYSRGGSIDTFTFKVLCKARAKLVIVKLPPIFRCHFIQSSSRKIIVKPINQAVFLLNCKLVIIPMRANMLT